MTAVCPEIVELEELDIPYVCMHPRHDEPRASHDTGPAVWWARTNHPCWGPVGIRYPVCDTYAKTWMNERIRPAIRSCYWCNQNVLFKDQVFIIGKIS